MAVFIGLCRNVYITETGKFYESGAGRWLLAKVFVIQAEGPEFRS